MSRQVDLKALVSHIIKGDGLDKCRICMGDTSQGQVHLTDTVMMDGDKAVTLSELLEVITGVEVEHEEDLPSSLCLTCSFSAFEAAEFRTLVQRTEPTWNNTVKLLQHVPDHEYAQTSDKILAVVSNNVIDITDECTKPVEKPKGPIIKRHGKLLHCKCFKCGKKFTYASLLHTHLKESSDLIRACHICAEIMSRDELASHLKETHSMKPFECNKCPALFLNAKPHSEHLLKAHAPGTRTCVDCSRSFKSLPALYAHQTVHSRRSCPNCDKNFQNQPCFSYHIKKCCKLDTAKDQLKPKVTVTLHNKENKMVTMGKRGSMNNKCICDHCNKTFAAKKFLAAHIQIVHLKNTHRPCIHCGKLFAAAHMSTHLASHAPPRFECDHCGNILKTKLGFAQHLRLHTGERPYKCKICGETFSSASSRSVHNMRKHSKSQIVLKHVCTLCPAKFRVPSMLKLHVQKTHKDGDQKGTENEVPFSYECAKCHEKFISCRSLVAHSRKHI